MAQGYKDWTAGAVLTAADLEDYAELQTTMRFASAAARNTALSGVLIEGLRCYLTDLNVEQVYSGSAWSTVGPVHGALTAWTPTVTQSGTVTKTVTYGAYSRVGRRIHASCLLAITGSGTASNLITLSLPTGATNDGVVLGTGYINDASVPTWYPGIVQATGSGANCYLNTTGGGLSEPNSRLGSAVFTAGLASGDAIAVQLSYDTSADA